MANLKKIHNPENFNVGLKVILKNKMGEILALKMPMNSTMAGYYDLPGGRINTDEIKIPYDKIIKREVSEEIGKSVKYRLIKKPVSIARHLYFSYKLKRKVYIFFIFFEALFLEGNIKISDEHINYKWIKINNEKIISKYFVRGLREGLKNYVLNT